MQKSERTIYGTPLMDASGNAIKYFVLAFTIKEKRVEHLEEAMGWYAVLRNDLEFCVDENLIHWAKPKKKEGDDMYFVTDNKKAFLTYFIPEIRKRLEPLGARLNHKFYCQHYTKGCECLGTHIKMDRLYANNRIIRRAKKKARDCNKRINGNRVGKVLASLNSYLGICKNLNGFKRACEIVGELDEEWWKYIHFNKRRICLEANEEYKERNRIINKFRLQ